MESAEAKHYHRNAGKKLQEMLLMQGGINMKKSRTYKIELSYNQIMLLNRAIDEQIISKDNAGVDVINDSECKILREVKGIILNAYISNKE